MHRLLTLAWTLLLTLPALAWAQGTLYRCQRDEGPPSFQQAPCEPGSRGGKIEARPVPTTEMGANILERAQRIAEGRERTTEADLLQQFGPPTVTNVDIVDGLETRQHVYRYPDGSARYVYTRQGVVYAEQLWPAEGRRPTEPCYSKAQIRSAEVDASSIRLTPSERIAAQERWSRMRDCRR